METCFLEDYLAGRFPDYSLDLFAGDLSFSILSKFPDITVVYLSSNAFDSDIGYALQKRLFENSGRVINIIRCEDVNDNDVWEIRPEPLNSDLECEYEEFNKFLSGNDNSMNCTAEDFRLIKLIELYNAFKDR